MYSLEGSEDSQVRAALSGAKTQFRKVLKEQPTDLKPMKDPDFHLWDVWVWVGLGGDLTTKTPIIGLADKGDTVRVREYFRIEKGDPPHVVYRADSPTGASDHGGKWEAPDNMPKWAVRMNLTITDVRLQRLQDISEEDARAEGALYRKDDRSRWWAECYGPECPTDAARSCNAHGCWGIREQFKGLWDSINAKRGYGWDENPWVAAYTFTVERKNIDDC